MVSENIYDIIYWAIRPKTVSIIFGSTFLGKIRLSLYRNA